jgi:hypothetical protein
MSEHPKFDYGETVQITSKEHNGRIGAVVGINGSESSRTYTVEFGDGSEADIAEEFLSKCESTMKVNVRAGLVFAALGFAIVVAIGVLYLNLNASPTIWLLRLAPATIVFATEDPGWTELLVVVAPLNAALYGGIAFAVTSVLRYFLERHRGASSAR